MSSSLVTQLLTAGACFSYDEAGGETFQACALQPLECARNKFQLFHSSLWLTSNDPMRAAECALQENIKIIPAMGRCDAEGERFICTSHRTGCRFSATFQEYDSDCRVVYDYSKTNLVFDKSYFPRCLVQDTWDTIAFCVWQFNECPSDKYGFAVADDFGALGKPNCQCDQVKVGACISSINSNTNENEGSSYFCAVSKEVCDTEDNYSYLNALQVESQLNVTCKLCDTLPFADTQGKTGGNMPSTPTMTPPAMIQPTTTPRPSQTRIINPTTPPSRPSPTRITPTSSTPLIKSVDSSQLTGAGDDVLVRNEKKSSLTSGQTAGVVIGTLAILLLMVGVYTKVTSSQQWCTRNEKEIIEEAPQGANSLAIDRTDPEERSMASIQ